MGPMFLYSCLIYVAKMLHIDVPVEIPLIERSMTYTTGIFLFGMGLLFWTILHMIFLFFASRWAASKFQNPNSVSKHKSLRVHSSRMMSPSKTNQDEFETSPQSIELKREKLVIAAWKFTNYSILSALGICILSQSGDWIREYRLYAVPISHVPIAYAIYYHLAISSYVYASIFLFIDPKLKDFHVMIAHHVTTLVLLVGSYYYIGALRIGMVVMILHDICDPLMELAKVAIYLDHKTLANILFVSFAIVFIIARCIVYPFFVVFPMILIEGKYHVPGKHFHAGMLCLIMVMDFFWAYLILQMIFKQIAKGQVEKDSRED